jgi:hypothetical protein
MSFYSNDYDDHAEFLAEEEQESYGNYVEMMRKKEQDMKKKEEEMKKKEEEMLEEENKKANQARLNAWYTINLCVKGMDKDTENPLEKVREGLRVYGDVMNHSHAIKWQGPREFILYGFKIRRFEDDERGSLTETIRERFYSDRNTNIFYTVTNGTEQVRKCAFVTGYKGDVKSAYVYELMEALATAEGNLLHQEQLYQQLQNKYEQLQTKQEKLQTYCDYLWRADCSVSVDSSMNLPQNVSSDTDDSPMPPRPPRAVRSSHYFEPQPYDEPPKVDPVNYGFQYRFNHK